MFIVRKVYHLVGIWKGAMEDCLQHLGHLGHFEYVGVSFGLSNAPAVFQALVFNILRDLINHFVFG